MLTWWDGLNTLMKERLTILIIAAGLFLASVALDRILKALAKRFEAQNRPWPRIVVVALGRPLITYLWLVLVSIVLYRVIDWWYPELQYWWLGSLNSIIALFMLLWFGLRVVRGAETFFVKALPMDARRSAKAAEIKALVKLVQIIFFMLTGLILLGIFDVPVSALLTFGGVSGIAVAVAGKDFLSNFLGGLFIYFDRHFVVGDWVYSPDRNIEGIVEDINMRFVTIRRFDKQLLFLPNSLLSSILLVNVSRTTHQRFDLKLSLTYHDTAELGAIIAEFRQFIAKAEFIDAKQDIQVSIEKISSFAADIKVVCYTLTRNYLAYKKLQDELLMSLQDIAAKHNEVIT